MVKTVNTRPSLVSAGGRTAVEPVTAAGEMPHGTWPQSDTPPKIARVPIYLDHAATSPMPAEVLEVYTRELARRANPSALHAVGQAARMRIEEAREDIARAVVAATSSEVIFTSGGTEADNLALKGLYLSRINGSFDAPTRPRVLTTRIEHHAVLDSVDWLADLGAERSEERRAG